MCGGTRGKRLEERVKGTGKTAEVASNQTERSMAAREQPTHWVDKVLSQDSDQHLRQDEREEGSV